MKPNDQNNPPKPKNRQKSLDFSGLIFFLLIASTIIYGFFYLKNSFNNQIYPQITIANQAVSHKTKDEAKQQILDFINKIDQNGPQIVYKNQLLNPRFSQLGISFNIDETVDKAYNYGRSDDFWANIKDLTKLINHKKDFSLTPVIEDKILANYFDFVSSTINISPKNSTVIYVDNEFIATEAKTGLGLDQEDFNLKIMEFINGGSNKFELKTGELKPTITPKDTVSAINTATLYVQVAPITIVFEDKKILADNAEIAKWVTFTEDDGLLSAEISETKLGEFINPIIATIEIKKVDRETVIDSGKVINEGTDGRGVDKDKLIGDIKAVLLNQTKATTIPIPTFVIGRGEKKVATIFVPGEYNGRYIDINLSEQKLRLYDGPNLINEYSVSTGKWSMPTPIGVRYIENKNEMAWSNKYQLYMPWWNSIGNGYGIHELPMWPNGYHEGESHLGTPVSHGCIRLGIGPAEFVYNWAPIGTPVYIHK